MIEFLRQRREMMKLSVLGLAGAAALAGGATTGARQAAAQAAPNSQLRTLPPTALPPTLLTRCHPPLPCLNRSTDT
jgi:hypothetical protein